MQGYYARCLIRWGTSYENDLELGWPPDARSAWRAPADRSGRGRTSTLEVSTVTGWDHFLALSLRWVPWGPIPSSAGLPPVSGWGGSGGVQAFLDYARDGGPFRFLPDASVSGFYVDACYLVSPDDGKPAPEADGTFSLPVVIRSRAMSFADALRGVMFDYAPGGDLTGATFSRASTAKYRKRPRTGGVDATLGAEVASGVLRDRHFEGALLTTLLEGSAAQLVAQPDNFGNAAWTKESGCFVSGGNLDPFGGTTAYVISDTGVGDQRIYDEVGFSAGTATRSIALFVAQNSSAPDMSFGIFDLTATTWRHEIKVTFNGASPPTVTTQVGSGTIFEVSNYGGAFKPYWRISASVDGVVGVNDNRFYIDPSYTDATGTIVAFGANAWDSPVPYSYQSAAATRNADDLSFPMPFKPQPCFFYTKFVERGTARLSVNASGGHGTIGAGSNQSGKTSIFHVYEFSGGTHYYSFYHRGPLSDRASNRDVSGLVYGDVVELLGLLYPDGSVRLNTVVNGAAEVVGTLSSALPEGIQADWGTSDRIYLATYGTGMTNGREGQIRTKVGPLTFAGRTIDTIAKAREV